MDTWRDVSQSLKHQIELKMKGEEEGGGGGGGGGGISFCCCFYVRERERREF